MTPEELVLLAIAWLLCGVLAWLIDVRRHGITFNPDFILGPVGLLAIGSQVLAELLHRIPPLSTDRLAARYRAYAKRQSRSPSSPTENTQ